MKRRIAILTNYPADLKSFTGGVETATQGLLEGLKKYQNEFDFQIISLSKIINKDLEISHDGYAFHFLAVPKNLLLKPHLPYNILKTLFKLKKLKPDLIHCQDNMALAVATILGGYPRIFTIHGVKKLEAKLWKGKEYLSHQMDRILEWFVHRNFNYFIAISPHISSLLNNKKAIFNIPNPISGNFFASKTPAVLGKSSKNRYLLYIGPIVYLKQVHILVKAFLKIKKEHKNLQLIICGNQEDEKYLRELKKIIKENGINGIRFIEHLSREELIEYTKGALALVLPSLQENSPMVIAEAMALGTPIIATRVGGIPYMVEDKKTGLLFNPGDYESLSSCIKLLIENNDLRKKIGCAAFKLARNLHNPDRIAELTVNVYKVMLRKN
ncbi:MAG: glycosyltransferase family 4 protein [candidate division WOR-3 bacterium]